MKYFWKSGWSGDVHIAVWNHMKNTTWTSRLQGFVLLSVLIFSGCATQPTTRDDVGRIPDRLVSGIITVKSAETAFVEQHQLLTEAVSKRQSSRIAAVEKSVAATIASLHDIGADPNWVPAQRDLLGQIIARYQAYFSEYGQVARLWIVEQPAEPRDSGLADQQKTLTNQAEGIRRDLKKLADMMAWELTRKIDTVNSLILNAP